MAWAKMNGSRDSDESEFARLRLERLERTIGKSVIADGQLPQNVPLVTVTCSRLGLDPRVHREVCRFLTRSMLDCRQRGAAIVIANGSAIDPWATRAAELFSVPVIRIFVNESSSGLHQGNEYLVRSVDQTRLCRDQVIIALADRVDAIHVRRGGKVFDAIQQRLRDGNDVTTRVAISLVENETALALINDGAIGWYCSSTNCDTNRDKFPEATIDDLAVDESLEWACSDGQWLVHSTRACEGPWPGQTQRQYRDNMLLSDESVAERTPLDTLARIIRHQKLFGSAIATDHRFPVVCFSAASLHERLQSRCYRPHLKRWDCEPYGIAIRIDTAQRAGATSVIYGQGDDRKRLAADQQYRFQSQGTTYDWTAEREWRVRGDVDLAACDPIDIRVFVPTAADARKIAAAAVPKCPWKISCVSPLLHSDAIIPPFTESSFHQ